MVDQVFAMTSFFHCTRHVCADFYDIRGEHSESKNQKHNSKQKGTLSLL